jgi:hypothetical protein
LLHNKTKKMKRLIVSALVTIVVTMNAAAQDLKKFSFSIGPELGIATGSSTHSLGIGGTAQAEYYIMDNLKGTATFGLLNYVGKSFGSATDYAALRILPLRVGAKYFLSGGFYGAAQLGVAFLGNFGSGAAFAYSPVMLGYEFDTKSGKSIDATVKYDGYSGSRYNAVTNRGIGTFGSVGIRVAYVF